MNVGIYVRVSTLQQTTDNQKLELYEVCERNDWIVVEEYNETVSGTKGESDRDELKRMLTDASRRKFDKLVVWSVDRLGRNMKHLVTVLSQMKDLDVDIYSYKQGIDTSTTMGSSFFYMVGIFAELENNMRSERQKIGIRRALESGAKFGRKSKLSKSVLTQIHSLREQGQSMRQISKELDISVATVHKGCSEKVVENRQCSTA
ncbi:MAG: resolvase [Gammaproteobacteria bacterium]|nr:resolvase [Gammaproteobacteria bacterium]